MIHAPTATPSAFCAGSEPARSRRVDRGVKFAMRRLCALVLLFGGIAPAAAQTTPPVLGFAVDPTGEPVADATVTFYPTTVAPDWLAEHLAPDPVDEHAGGQRIGAIGDGLSQFAATAALFKFPTVAVAENLQEAAANHIASPMR